MEENASKGTLSAAAAIEYKSGICDSGGDGGVDGAVDAGVGIT